MRNIVKTAAAAALLALFGLGCQAKPEALPEGANSFKVEPAATTTTPGLARSADGRIEMGEMKLDDKGQLPLTFHLYDTDKHELTPADLKIAHEKKLHVIVTRADLRSFQHLYPVYEKGAWKATAKIVQPGPYLFFFDFVTAKDVNEVLRIVVKFGDVPGTDLPKTDPRFFVESPPYRATMTLEDNFRVGTTSTLSFHLTKDGKPLMELKPYLGAFGQATLFGHRSPDDYFHVRPLTLAKPKDGVVSFEAFFPNYGRYTIFPEFDVGVGTRVFPMTVDVIMPGPSAPVSSTGTPSVAN